MNNQGNDKTKVLIGLAILTAVAVFPLVYNTVGSAVLGNSIAKPDIVLTEKAKAAKICVRETEYMKAEHMQLLDVWRENVVRQGKRTYVNAQGKKFDMSLQNTCLDCHSNKAEFCDRCHNYASVRPYCWDCHVENPKEMKE